MRNTKYLPFALAVLAALAWTSLAAAPAAAWLDNPVTPVAHDVRSLFFKALGITAVFFITAQVLLLIAVIRFRSRPGVQAATFHDNLRLEIVWTAIPALAMVILAGPTFTSLRYMDTIPKSDLNIEIIGHQWFWEYRYPKYNVTFANEPLVIPVGKVVSADVTSIDVVHSWFMPDFGVKLDANPGRVNHTWFQVEKTGTYVGQCAELCGVLHAEMKIEVHVVSDEEFRRWIEQKRTGA
jgi:cytochrome c oxidase subunit II